MTKGDNMNEEELNELLRKLYLEENAEKIDEATAQFVMSQEYNVKIDAKKEQQLLKKLSGKPGWLGNYFYFIASFVAIGSIATILYFTSSSDKNNSETEEYKNESLEKTSIDTVSNNDVGNTSSIKNTAQKENTSSQKDQNSESPSNSSSNNITSVSQNKTDTLKLFYEINEKELTPYHTRLIDAALAKKNTPDYKIEIISYTDYLATNEYNKILSVERAKNVQAYLLKKGVKSTWMESCEGKGEIENSAANNDKAGVPSNRRTEIIFKYKVDELPVKINLVPENKLPTPSITIKDSNSLKTTALSIDSINKLDVGQSLVLQNLNFYPGSHYYVKESEKELKKLLKVMQENPKLKIEIQGHITAECPECLKNKTRDSYDVLWGDWHLSRNRAEFIFDYLVKKRIDKIRMTFVGFGNTKPLVYPEITEKDREKNRRVEIKILEK